MATITICSDFGAQNAWKYLNNSLSLLLKCLCWRSLGSWCKGRSGSLSAGDKFTATGGKPAGFCPQVCGGHSRRCPGPGVWWPNLVWLPGRESLWQLGFSLAFSGSVGSPPWSCFSTQWIEGGKSNKGLPLSKSHESWQENAGVSRDQHLDAAWTCHAVWIM